MPATIILSVTFSAIKREKYLCRRQFLPVINSTVTQPWWLSGLEHQSISRPMLKVPSSNAAMAKDITNNDGFFGV